MSTAKRIDTYKKKAKTGRPKTVRRTARVQTTQPWSQHPEEGPKSYRAFAAFRDMGPERSLKKLAQKGFTVPGEAGGHKKLTYNTLTAYSKTFDWAHRAAAYDRNQDRIQQAMHREAGRRAGRRAARLAAAWQLTSWKVWRAIHRRIEKDYQMIDRMKPGELMNLFTSLGKLQKDLQGMNRLTFGEPTEILLTEAPTAPGGLFSEADDFMTVVHADNEATDLFNQLNARVYKVRAANKVSTTEKVLR